ncbi:hypothetical protein FHH43_08475 [Clostridium perfringens]|nr:hypothetical protein [Clostridium perfringens]
MRQLNILEQMGMWYLTLGQPSWFLSGGEIIGKGTPEELRDNQNSRTNRRVAFMNNINQRKKAWLKGK